MSNTLVVGGAGFVGSHVQDALVLLGHSVTVLDNLSTGTLKNLNSRTNFLEADITNNHTFADLSKFDFVFHLAALARIQPSIDDPVIAHEANVNGTLNVLEYCRRTKTKLIFSGSSSVYAGLDLPTTEDAPKAPKSPYSLQKWICEQYIELYGALYGLDYVILRYFNVYGPRQLLEGAYAAVTGIFLRQEREGTALTITGDGEQRRDMTHVSDVALANVLAMHWGKGTYNIGTGKSHSINQIADAISKYQVHIPEPPGEVRETLADNSRAKEKGWVPSIDIIEWLKSEA